MFFDFIFGRLIAYISDDGFLNDDEWARFKPCAGQDFDIIFYKEEDPLLERSLLHEEIHAALDRVGIGLRLSEDLEENLCEALSIFLDETYEMKRRRKL